MNMNMNVIMNTKKPPVGISDFREMVTGDYYYVDKTLYIKEVIDKGDKILLIPRPRRFGKTLNLSMLKYFYDCKPGDDGNKKLFHSLAIHKAGNKYLDKMGKHPVIFLSFKNIKELEWEFCFSKTKQLIQEEYLKHDYLLDGSNSKLKKQEQEYFKRIIDLKGNRGDYENSLGKLLIFLYRYHGKPAVILIDEYDAPVHAGFTHGYYEEIINFTRNFLCGGLKDTDQYLEKSVLTGIMRIAKESIFSGLNNPGVYTLLSQVFNDKFGFTEEEVEALLKDFQRFDWYGLVREWYNGYRFGETVIYNPWSIICFLAEDAKKGKPYWINTSDNAVVESLLSRGGKELKEEMEVLIRGETIEKAIDDNIVLKHVESDDNALWSFLLMGGYLKPTAERPAPGGDEIYYSLAVPNREVRSVYSSIIRRYFITKVENKKLEIMLNALIEGDVKLFGKMLRKVVTAVFSYHDFGGEPEKVYHALVAGMLIWISGTHEITSNRESGYGRYDIMIFPRPLEGEAYKERTGYVIEFKTVDEEENETVESAAEAALNQIEAKKYETELVERGIKNIKKLAIVFKGKEVTVKEG
jgi:hypothetical protein